MKGVLSGSDIALLLKFQKSCTMMSVRCADVLWKGTSHETVSDLTLHMADLLTNMVAFCHASNISYDEIDKLLKKDTNEN